MGTVRYFVRAVRARWHYRGPGAPCLACVWENGDDDTPYHWIYCTRCDWGNQ